MYMQILVSWRFALKYPIPECYLSHVERSLDPQTIMSKRDNRTFLFPENNKNNN